VEYNSDGWFIEKPTLILGTSGQLQSMVYFWNMRATYPKNKTLWMPIDLAERYLGLLGNYEHFGSFVGTVPDQTSVANALQKMTEIDCSKYYFPVLQYWNTFAHVQNVPVVDERINVSHPSEKIFSGVSFNTMLEIRGLEETILPISCATGELFVDRNIKQSSHYVTSRISKTGLAASVGTFDIYSKHDLFLRVQIPSHREVFNTIFRDHGMNLTETKTRKTIDQTINLVGGLEGLSALLDPNIHSLLVALTPQRVSRIVKEIKRELPAQPSEAALHKAIGKNINNLSILQQNKVVSAGDLLSLVGRQVSDRDQFFAKVEGLYQKNVLLRGKSFACSSCDGELWLPLESIQEENKCYRCRQPVSIPVMSKESRLRTHTDSMS
jgi:hypothetical protein